jgi:hypothetical protein
MSQTFQFLDELIIGSKDKKEYLASQIDSGSYVNSYTSFDTFLIVGQSNAKGSGLPKDIRLDITDPRIFAYSPGTSTYSNTLVQAEGSIGNIEGTYETDTIGFALPFARNYIAENPTKRVCLLGCTLGNTGFSSNHWKVGDSLFNITVAHVNAFLAAYPGSKLKGILWHQGERDHDSNNPVINYRTSLEAMIAGFRSQITGATNVPFICGNYSPQWSQWSDLKADYELLNSQLPNRIDYTGFASSIGLTGNSGDVIHFDARSQRILGNRYFEAYKSAIGNIVSIPDAPANLAVSQLTGTTLRVAFDLNPKAESYLVSARIGSNILSSVSTVENSTIVPNLQPSTSYSIEVKALNSKGYSVPSTLMAVTNAVTVPVIANGIFILDYENPANLTASTGLFPIGGTGTLTSFVDSKRGNVLRLQNSENQGSLISYEDASNLGLTNQITFSTFVNLEAYRNDLSLFSIDSGDNLGKLIFMIDEVSNFQLQLNGVVFSEVPGVFKKNTWTMVSFTIGGGTAKIFINGRKVKEDPGTIVINNTNKPIFIGQLGFNYGTLEGKLDKTRVYSYALTENQIVRLFEQDYIL